MIKEGKFGPQEAIWLITITIVAKVFYTSPSAVSSLVGTAQWYMTLISVSVAVIGFSFLHLLLKRFQSKDIIEIFEITFGRLLGSIFSGLLALFMVNVAAIRMREFTEVVKVYTLPLTPAALITFLFIGAVAVLNLLGLEVIARFSKLFAYTMVAGFIIVVILGQQNYSIHRLLPILGYGIDKTVYHGIIRSSVYGEVIMLAVFAGSLQGVKHIKKVGYTSLVISGLFICIASLAYTLTFPYYVAMEITSPMYEMTKLIDYGRFLQRVEPIILFILSISSLISVSAVFYTSVSIYCKIFRIQDTKPVILAGTIIVFALSMSDKSISEVTFKSVKSIRDYGGVFFYIPPLIALIAARFRRKGGTNDA